MLSSVRQPYSLLLTSQAYPSLKPLASWTRDLVLRVEQISQWATTIQPPVHFWLPGFTLPMGFLTAVIQTVARKNNVMAETVHSVVSTSNLSLY